jgi:hypothetical protein
VGFLVLGQVHGGHAAGAELALDAVGVGQGGAEAVHGGILTHPAYAGQSRYDAASRAGRVAGLGSRRPSPSRRDGL